jgi:tetratricopeptide (TPR) repeat protein
LIDLELGRWEYYRRRATAYAHLGQWQKASLDYTEALALQPDNPWLVYEYAGVQLMCGDTEGYRQSCRRLLERWGETTNPGIAGIAARTLVLLPDRDQNAARSVGLATKGEALRPKDRWYPWYLHVLGTAYYRAGQYEQAIHRLEECLNAHPNWKERGLNWLVLAMAYQRQDKTDEARQALDKAVQWGDQLAQNQPPGAQHALHVRVMDWLEYNILRREAEAQIKGNPASQK